MKHHQVLIICVLTVAWPLLSPAEDHSVALKAFKKEMEELAASTKKEEIKLKDNPFAGVLLVRNAGTRLRAIDSENLPEDLKAAFNDFVVAISVFGDLYQGWPEDAEAIKAYIVKMKAEDPEFGEKLQKRTEAATKKLAPAQARFEEVSKKYNIES